MAKKEREGRKRQAKKQARRDKRQKKKAEKNMSDAARLYRVVLKIIGVFLLTWWFANEQPLELLGSGVLRGGRG